MGLIQKKIKNKEYYYYDITFRILNKTKHFQKYIGLKKPKQHELKKIESNLYLEILKKLTNNYKCEYLSQHDLIQALLFKDLYNQKFKKLSHIKKKKLNIDKILLFTLTTLTTEDVDVSVKDVLEAYKKTKDLSLREQICKNMLEAIELISIKKKRIDIQFIQFLHKTAMANFETKTPGLFRDKQVYIYKKETDAILGSEISYRPPAHGLILNFLEDFIAWYNKTDINILEKAALAHFKLYKIHPFLDGNKRVCRLIFNKVLLDNDFPLMNLSDRKGEYFNALIYSVEKDNPKYFIDFVYEQYIKEIKNFLTKKY